MLKITEGQYLEAESLWEGIQDSSRWGQDCADLCKEEDERICRDLCCSLGSLVNRWHVTLTSPQFLSPYSVSRVSICKLAMYSEWALTVKEVLHCWFWSRVGRMSDQGDPNFCPRSRNWRKTLVIIIDMVNVETIPYSHSKSNMQSSTQ
jgi:hypothetical protein